MSIHNVRTLTGCRPQAGKYDFEMGFNMDKARLAAMDKAPLGYAKKIKDKSEFLLDVHYCETFTN